MELVGFSEQSIEECMRIVAAVLHLGAIDFVEKKKEEGFRIKDRNGTCSLSFWISSFLSFIYIIIELKKAADCFMVEPNVLETALTNRTIKDTSAQRKDMVTPLKMNEVRCISFPLYSCHSSEILIVSSFNACCLCYCFLFCF